jgi:hypothetical protein
MGIFDRCKKPAEEETFFKFYVSKDGESVDYNFEAKDLDKFLQMMSLLLSGGISEEIIACIFKEIDDDEVKEAFILDLLNRTEESLKEKGDSLVVSPSEFSV